MREIRLISILIATLLLAGCSSGRGLKAKKSFEIGEYDRAERGLKSAYAKEKNKSLKAEYSFYLAECYRIKGQARKAAGAYNRAVRYKYQDNIAILNMADCYRSYGEYQKAIDAYNLYLTKKAGDLRALNGLESCMYAQKEQEAESALYEVVKSKEFSSKYSDYSPCYAGDNSEIVYFSTMRTAKKARKRNKVTGQGNSTIHMSKIDGKGNWTYPEPLEEPFASTFDDGTPCMTSDGKTMYFTRCPYDPTKANTAEVYEVKRSGGRWSDPMRVIPGNDSTMMVAHPAISPDGNTLYFVSDCDGGIGGKDIYKTHKTETGWSKAENLGAIINTKADEMFPYIRMDGTLYFSSNGHIGFGGLDIYKVEISESGTPRVINMGQPINSIGDDFGICFKGKTEEGLFTSSRASAKGIDDIYTFVLPPVVLSLDGSITDINDKPIKGSYVRIIGSDGTNERISPNGDGTFTFVLQPETDYVLMGGAKGFLNQKHNFSTLDVKRSKSYEEHIRLESVLR